MIHVVIAMIHQDRLLCVGQRKQEPFKGYFECPGGKVEAGESLREALDRELFEEGHALVACAAYLFHTDVINPHGHFRLHWFKTTLKTPFLPIIYDEVRMVPVDEVKHLDWIPHNIPTLPLIEASLDLPTLSPSWTYEPGPAFVESLQSSMKDPSYYKENIHLDLNGYRWEEMDEQTQSLIKLYSIKLQP